MAKRFTDTEKWKKPFVRGLQAPYKLLWFYITDDCDHAGIWQVDLEVAALRIGESEINIETALEQFGAKIIPFANGEKWFIPDFIDFQYNGALNPANKTHQSVIKILTKHKLIDQITTTTKEDLSPLQGAKDKELDKDKEKDMVKGGVGEKQKEIAKAIDEYFEEPEQVLDSVYQDPDGFNEEEYAEAVKFLIKSNVYSLVQQHHRKQSDEVLLLFKTFYEQKRGFGELRNKTATDVMKWFYQWVPKYLEHNKADKPKGSLLERQIEAAKARQTEYN